MTSFSQATKSSQPSRRGFTLVEMLVVVGIIVVLVGILLPAVNKVYTQAIRTRMKMDVQTIVAAMEAYKADMRDYPRIDYTDPVLVSANGTSGTAPTGASNPGAVTLCSALVGPGTTFMDGAGGTGVGTGFTTGIFPGFSVRPQGQVYGPYVDISRFKFVADATMGTTVPNASGKFESVLCLADRYNHPILYFRANANVIYRQSAPSTTSPGFVADVGPTGPTGGGTLPFYNYEDNPVALRWPADSAGTNTNGLARMQMMLGDKDHNGWIDTVSLADGLPEVPVTTLPYLIWSAGPDELFGFDPADPGASPVPGSIGSTKVAYTKIATSDDATNFNN